MVGVSEGVERSASVPKTVKTGGSLGSQVKDKVCGRIFSLNTQMKNGGSRNLTDTHEPCWLIVR